MSQVRNENPEPGSFSSQSTRRHIKPPLLAPCPSTKVSTHREEGLRLEQESGFSAYKSLSSWEEEGKAD